MRKTSRNRGNTITEFQHKLCFAFGQDLNEGLVNASGVSFDRFQKQFVTRTPMEVRATATAAEIPDQFPIAGHKRIQKRKAAFAAQENPQILSSRSGPAGN